MGRGQVEVIHDLRMVTMWLQTQGDSNVINAVFSLSSAVRPRVVVPLVNLASGRQEEIKGVQEISKSCRTGRGGKSLLLDSGAISCSWFRIGISEEK